MPTTHAEPVAAKETTTRPSVPLKTHVVPKLPDGTLADQALCGHLWDRLLRAGRVECVECKLELLRLHPELLGL